MNGTTTARLQNLQNSLSRLQPNPPLNEQAYVQKVNDIQVKVENYQKSDEAKFQLLADNLNKLIEAESAEMSSFELLDKRESKQIDLVYASLSEALTNETEIREELEAGLLQLMQDRFAQQTNNVHQQIATRQHQDETQLSYMRENMTKIVERAQSDREETDVLISGLGSELDEYVNELRELLVTEQNDREQRQESFQETLSKVCQMLQEKLQTERAERERVEEQLVGLMELICEKMG